MQYTAHASCILYTIIIIIILFIFYKIGARTSQSIIKMHYYVHVSRVSVLKLSEEVFVFVL